ncbi:hypothetical protein MLP_15230 [Microlunatus phosphovorus NM-1]|uniref:Uncharacterized protein n=1 Tax=Microlunatus phosphovorus (strain ATCC 700054 / DSM 10555 / JCM 9379 / NBRC 101784 / NCIMB 13414 / VKM Ac-1990 / NM-1) TaxID=1032480 RepID=F5XQN7_MICPN|nr:hypothetical protein MLP_15230 [Microlunatus phosphovorus NM-1]
MRARCRRRASGRREWLPGRSCSCSFSQLFLAFRAQYVIAPTLPREANGWTDDINVGAVGYVPGFDL